MAASRIPTPSTSEAHDQPLANPQPIPAPGHEPYLSHQYKFICPHLDCRVRPNLFIDTVGFVDHVSEHHHHFLINLIAAMRNPIPYTSNYNGPGVPMSHTPSDQRRTPHELLARKASNEIINVADEQRTALNGGETKRISFNPAARSFSPGRVGLPLAGTGAARTDTDSSVWSRNDRTWILQGLSEEDCLQPSATNPLQQSRNT